jgi:hypothetical protein
MSDSENLPPTPSKQTSSVPLKKETVRVTLKAADAPASPMAPPPPVASAPTTPPPAPAVPRPPTAQVGVPPAPAPTIPLKTAGAPPIAAPTIRLATPGGASAGAPTIQLRTPTSPAPTAPGGGAVPSVQLPKATVQLQPTQPLGTMGATTISAATLQATEDEEEKADTMGSILAILGFVAALGVLTFQFLTANIWVAGDWGKLFE